MRWHGWLGLAIMVAGEALLYARLGIVATWFTPIMWTGYILLADGWIARRTGASWLTTRRREFGFLAVLSVLSWLVFEVYNLKLRNWAYVGVPPAAWVRNIGFFWSFATITPAIFQTAELLEAWRPSPKPAPPARAASKQARQGSCAPRSMSLWAAAGLAFVIVPPALPDEIAPYAFGFVWLGLIPVLESINLRIGQPSLLRDWREGRRRRVWHWLAAGFLCGLMWELWNMQALAQGGAGWLYIMPDLIHNLIFGLHYGKMPLAGLLGFPPFAWECFAIYYFLRGTLQLEAVLG